MNCSEAREKGLCDGYITDQELESLNKSQGDQIWPLNVEWKNCVFALDYWLNCNIRKKGE